MCQPIPNIIIEQLLQVIDITQLKKLKFAQFQQFLLSSFIVLLLLEVNYSLIIVNLYSSYKLYTPKKHTELNLIEIFSLREKYYYMEQNAELKRKVFTDKSDFICFEHKIWKHPRCSMLICWKIEDKLAKWFLMDPTWNTILFT